MSDSERELQMLAARAAGFIVHNGFYGIDPADPVSFSRGWRSPIYINWRRIAGRSSLRERFLYEVLEPFFRLQYESIDDTIDIFAGVATAGMPWAQALCDSFDRDLCWVKPEEKKHGMGGAVAGEDVLGKIVLLIEDMRSTGGSVRDAAQHLRHAGAKKVYSLSLGSYDIAGVETGVREVCDTTWTVTDFPHLIAEIDRTGKHPPEHIAEVRRWQHNPDEWTQKWAAQQVVRADSHK